MGTNFGQQICQSTENGVRYLILDSLQNLKFEYSSMDDYSWRRNFDLDRKNENHYHSWKEHLKMSTIAKFGCELL